MNGMKCPNCGNENKNTNIRCEFCGAELNSIEPNDSFHNSHTLQIKLDLESKKVRYIINAIFIFLFVPWFLIGVAFIGVSTYSNISDYRNARNYLETEGKLISYENCEYDRDRDELCNAVYEYVVDGVTYTGSPKRLSTRTGFKETLTVKYNPNDPSEYVMDSGWNGLFITGIIIVAVVLILFIGSKISLKKLATKINQIAEKDNSVVNM